MSEKGEQTLSLSREADRPRRRWQRKGLRTFRPL